MSFGILVVQIPVAQEIFPTQHSRTPCSPAQGIRSEVFEFAGGPGEKNQSNVPETAKFPVYFPVINSREFGAETGSRWTASSANQSKL
jgi:hypothetical protein